MYNLFGDENKEIIRLLQQKGFNLSVIQSAKSIIDTQLNAKYFVEGLEICENCHLGGLSEKTFGTGPITSPLMIVGDASGEDKNGIPFTGPSGYFLTMALQYIGVDRRAVYLTNVIKCRNISTPNPDQIATCKPYFEYELEMVKPKVVITLGSTAIKTLTGKYEINISTVRGGVFNNGKMSVYPTWHPYHILNQSGVDYIKTRDEFLFDIERAIVHAKKINPSYRWIL